MVTPITQEDFQHFCADIQAMAPTSIVGYATSMEYSITAVWYCLHYKVTSSIYVSILKHFLSLDALERDQWEYNPSWVVAVERAVDLCYQRGKVSQQVTQAQFMEVVYPYALQLMGVSLWGS